jgi:site-specific recombinase XerD
LASKTQARWRDLDHSQELLIEHQTTRSSTRTTGPIPEFLAKKEAERAPKTFAWYCESLTQLWTFLEERELTTIGDFDEHVVNLFRLELRRRGLAENTISNRLRAIKAFARWLSERGWTDGNVLQHLHVPQSTKPTFDLIADGQRAKLFELYPSDTYLGSRNLAMLGVLSDTGLRREELVNIQLKNVDLDGHVLKVYSDKTEEWRYLPLTDEVVYLLRNHLRWRERYFSKAARSREFRGDDNRRARKARSIRSDHLFLAWNGEAITPHGFAEVLTRASRKLGVRIHAHLFRHDWITRKAMDGESPSVVKRWAGHKSYMMTDYYFSLAGDMLGAIKPKRSVLATLPLSGIQRRGRPPKAGVR